MKTRVLFLFLFAVLSGYSQKVTDTVAAQLAKLNDQKKLALLLKAGKTHLTENPEKSLGYGRSALKLAEKLSQPAESAEACLIISDGYLGKGPVDSALHFSRKALGIFRSLGLKLDMMRAENQTGIVFLSKGDGKEAENILSRTAEECTKQIKEFPEDEGWKSLTSEVFNNLFMAYVKQGNYALAKQRLFAFKGNHPVGNTFSGMLVLGNLATVYMMTEQYDSALMFADSALNVAKKLNEPLNIVKSYTDLGNIYYSTGQYSTASQNYSIAISILEPLGERQSLSRLYNNLASVYKQINYYEKATQYFLKSAKLKMALGDSAGLTVTYNNIGLVFKEMENYAMARKYLDMAVALNRKRKNIKSLGTNYNGIGDLFLRLGKADSAMFYYRKALEMKKQAGHKSGMVIAIQGIGNVYCDLLNNTRAATEQYQEALALAKEIHSSHDIADLNKRLGKLSFNKGELGNAEELLTQSLQYAQKEDALEMIRECSDMLTIINIRKNNEKKARMFHTMFGDAGDRLYNLQKTELTIEMQARFESERKEHENQLLLKSNELKSNQIRSLIIIAVVLFSLGFLALYLYRQKSKAYREIVRKNMEILENEKSQTKQVSKAGIPENLMDEESLKTIPNTSLGLVVKFTHMMEVEKPWLEPGLTIEDLCRKLRTNRTYLSQMINENYHKNFNIFINELRIKEARRLLADPACNHLSIQGIGNMAGFSTKAAFHANFKQFVGVTPSFFRKTVGAESKNIA